MRLLLICVLFVACGTTATAQQLACYPRDAFASLLANRYGEVLFFDAIMELEPAGKSVPIIVYAGPKSHTFTIVTNPSANVVCPIMKGSDLDIPQMPIFGGAQL